jgi:hypothetical protein
MKLFPKICIIRRKSFIFLQSDSTKEDLLRIHSVCVATMTYKNKFTFLKTL